MMNTIMRQVRDSEGFTIFGVFALVAVIIALVFGAWFFFYGYQEKVDVIVAPNSDGVYKRWSMRRVIETYTSDTTCTTNSDNQRHCSMDYDWEVINFIETSGVFRVDEPIEPPALPFRTCQRLVADSGCERERLEQQWLVRLEATDGSNKGWCGVARAQWDDNFTVESLWRLNRNRAQGWLCGTLRVRAA